MLFRVSCAQVLPFFESQGFRCPPRKGVADFLQEVTSPKDQAQYWCVATMNSNLHDFLALLSYIT